MARLTDLRPNFQVLSWQDKLVFIEAYRSKRYNDLNTVQEFDLRTTKKTKSTKVREPKEPKDKTVKKVSTKELSPEEIALLKQLGLA